LILESAMKATLFSLVFTANLAFGQYKMEPAGAPPAELPAPFTSIFQQQGYKVLSPSGSVFCEVWFRSAAPAPAKSSEEGAVFSTIPHGALLGVIRFPERGADRRGQMIKPGLYTLRYSLYPVNGDHQGVAPQRDFLVLAPIAEDQDPAATPAFDPLMNLGRKASGTPHPAVLELGKAEATTKFPALNQHGEQDWALDVKVGELPLSVVLIGRTEG
jgi:hypothetical protein